ncbi:type II RES/Xre toxin-antitoxin system antitoxin [Aquiflexum lacus]|uniref:type II RES/Xre toxin-antitoxin system antitoxin n=1 Tax=Aquiflexum lacus TaxID=2483805 RepID=UPI001892D53A|nr:antitoxin Xre/MbcA/ParS toxin-binding domain-containing protein [Aquiflexum lacus]
MDNLLNDFESTYTAAPRLTQKLIIKSRDGISFEEFEYFLDRSPIFIEEWAGLLHLSDRTLQRYKKDNKSFESIHSERILDLFMLFKFGEEVFGDKRPFQSWLHDQSIPLGNVTPLSLLDTSFGIVLVKEELGRIQHGIFA